MADNNVVKEPHYRYKLNKASLNKEDDKKIVWRQAELYDFKDDSYIKNEVDNTGSDESLTSPDDALSKNGWISPMEYYANNQHIAINDSRSVSNGYIQKKDDGSHSKFLYKDLYWWCEDLRNWCVYNVTCNIPYLNIFQLLVWNGKDDWVPIEGYKVNEQHNFAKLQNSFIELKQQNGDYIVTQRGSDIRTGFMFTGHGPLTVNHGLILTKTDKYSINDDNSFQAKRWSTPLHISGKDESYIMDSLVHTRANGNLGFIVKFRNAIRGGINCLTDDKNWSTEQDSFYTDTTSFNIYTSEDNSQRHQVLMKYHDGIEKEGNDDHLDNPDAAKNNGYEIYRKKHNAYKWYNGNNIANDDRGVHFLHAVDNLLDQKIQDYEKYSKIQRETAEERRKEFDDADFAEDIIYPINFYHHKYNHCQIRTIAWEKIFALYLIDNEGHFYSTDFAKDTFTEYYGKDTTAWLETLDDESSLDYKDVIIEDSGVKIYPIYVSLLDLLFLFKGLNMSELVQNGWGNQNPGKKNPATKPKMWKNGEAEDFTENIWRKRSKVTLQKIYAIVNQQWELGNSVKYNETEHKYEIIDSEKFKEFIEKSETVKYTTEDEIKIFYSTSETDVGVLYMDKFGGLSTNKPTGDIFKWDTETNITLKHVTDTFATINGNENFNTAMLANSAENRMARTMLGDNMIMRNIAYFGASVFGTTSDVVFSTIKNFQGVIENDISVGKHFGKGVGNIVQGILTLDTEKLFNAAENFSNMYLDLGKMYLAASMMVVDSVKSVVAGITTYFTGGDKDILHLQKDYRQYKAELKPVGLVYKVDDEHTHNSGDDKALFKSKNKEIVEDIVGSISDNNERMNNILKYSKLRTFFENMAIEINEYTSDLREGISIGNPAIWRMATGEIMMSTFLIWAGKERIIGGPDVYSHDEETGEKWISESGNYVGEKYINKLCQDWFGDGMEKTIDNNWLKFDTNDKDERAVNTSLIEPEYLEIGKSFVQTTVNMSESDIDDIKGKLTIKLKTYRPNIVTVGISENEDVAKKW